MPDRIIKESICTSDTLNQLSDFEERFWHRLTVCVDDYGRFDARPAILKSRLFPLRCGTTEKNMVDALHKLSSVGLVSLYEAEGKPFLQLATWAKYQRIRNKRSKYPEPDAGNRPSTDGTPPQCAANCGRNPIQSESESESNLNPRSGAAPEPASAAPAITLALNTGEEYPVPEAQITQWSALYPAVDVPQELRKMKGWCDAHPQKRKTKRGIDAFVTGWLSREQDRGKSQPAPPNGKGGNQFLRRLKEMENGDGA